MPLTGLLGGNKISTFEMSLEEWEALRKSYRDRVLVMPCCGAPGIPKVSHLGTRFFAHNKHGECGAAPESAAHLRAKWVIASAAVSAGWQAESEIQGSTPDGANWVADVFCTKGSVKVAFEVQLASQTLAGYRERQARYAASGVRGYWLAKRPPRVEEYDLPLFTLDIVDLEAPVVSVMELAVPLAEFVDGALNGRLKWMDGSPGKYRYHLGLTWADCWGCKKKVLLVHGISFAGFTTNMLPLLQVANEQIVDLTELVADVARIHEKTHSIATLKLRTSDKGISYLSPTCPHCNREFSEWRTLNTIHKRKVTQGIRMSTITVNKGSGWVDGVYFQVPSGWAWLGSHGSF